MTTRRSFIEGAALGALGLAVPPPGIIDLVRQSPASLSGAAGFLDLGRVPDGVFAQTESEYRPLATGPGGRWTGGSGIVATTTPGAEGVTVTLASPAVAVKRLHLRWRGSLADVRLILGDAWERAYGDLEWRGWVPDRVMPWYFATSTGALTHGYGVRTNCAAFCYWQVDPEGISLWADVRSGAAGVRLGERTLVVCDVVCRAGHEGESAFDAVRALCRAMCPAPRLPGEPVYGSNDWYWAYGKNSADSVRADARHIVELSPTGGIRPFAVIDDGWQPERRGGRNGAPAPGTGETRSSPTWRGSPGTSGGIGARPGIWIRPLLAPADAPDDWRLPRSRESLDPSVPEVAPEGDRGHRPAAAMGLRDDQARLLHLRCLRALGIPDGSLAHRRRLDLRGRSRPDQRRGARWAVSDDPGCRRRVARSSAATR